MAQCNKEPACSKAPNRVIWQLLNAWFKLNLSCWKFQHLKLRFQASSETEAQERFGRFHIIWTICSRIGDEVLFFVLICNSNSIWLGANYHSARWTIARALWQPPWKKHRRLSLPANKQIDFTYKSEILIAVVKSLCFSVCLILLLLAIKRSNEWGCSF